MNCFGVDSVSVAYWPCAFWHLAIIGFLIINCELSRCWKLIASLLHGDRKRSVRSCCQILKHKMRILLDWIGFIREGKKQWSEVFHLILIRIVHSMVVWKFTYKTSRVEYWGNFAVDRIRFKYRIRSLHSIILLVLGTTHKDKVYKEDSYWNYKYMQILDF